MNRTLARFALLALVVAIASTSTRNSFAASITTGVNLPNGSFQTTLSGTGNAALTGASGNYRTWTSLGIFGWASTNTGVSAGNQTVGINMSNVNINNSVASGSANITYDDITPGTPISMNTLNADLNGAGESNQNYPFSITANPINITINSIVPITTQLQLTVNGAITDATFTSTGSSPSSPYAINGNLSLTLQGTVTGALVNVPLIGTISLGTLFTLPPTVVPIATTLPGIETLTDLSGGLGPFPSTMHVDLAALIPLSIPVPFVLPFSTSQVFPDTDHVSKFTSLTINNGSQLNLTLNLGNPGYNLNGNLPLALVPEPSSIVLSGAGLFALGALVYRRRRAA